MKKNRVRSLLALGLSLTMMVSIMGCGKQQRLDAEINPDTPVSDVQFPLKETEELSFITSAPATSTQDPNKRVIFQRMEEQTNVHIDWTCFVSDQFSDKKNLALAQFGNLPDGLFNAGMSDYDLLRYAKQGIIIPLENLIDKYMPNLQAVFEKYPEFEEDTAMNVMLSFCIQGSYHAYQKNRSGDIMTVIDVIAGMTGAVRPMYEERLGESRS